MKIDEFNKYRQIVESNDLSLEEYPEAIKIYEWLKDTGRLQDEHLDEGLLSSMWSWLKRNFSIRARRIHKLADEFEKELMEEGRAEFNKTKDAKDLAAKYRAGTYNRLSRDIEDRMEIIAEDDEDYRELVRTLINKKTLDVKKTLIKELSGRLDPEDYSELYKDTERESKRADEEWNKVARRMAMDKKDELENIKKIMDKKISDEKSFFKPIGVDSGEAKITFIKMLFTYANILAEKNKNFIINDKSVYRIAKDYVEFAKIMIKKIESAVGKDEAISIVKKEIDKVVKDTTKPMTFDRIKPIVAKEIEKRIGNSGDSKIDFSDIEDEITASNTDDVLDNSEIKTGIKDAQENTGKKHPSSNDVIDEIKEEVEQIFSDDNIPTYTERVNKKIEEFNALPDDKRQKASTNYDYELDDQNKLKPVSDDDVKKLVDSFIDVVGTILPYYLKQEKKVSTSTSTVMRFLFEIYAIKKDGNLLKQSEKNTLIDNIKKHYPEDFR